MTVLEFLSKTVAHFQIDSTKNRGIPQRRPAGARNLQKPDPSLVDGLDPEVRHCGGMSLGHWLNVWRSQRCWVNFTNPCKHVVTKALCTLTTHQESAKQTCLRTTSPDRNNADHLQSCSKVPATTFWEAPTSLLPLPDSTRSVKNTSDPRAVSVEHRGDPNLPAVGFEWKK